MSKHLILIGHLAVGEQFDEILIDCIHFQPTGTSLEKGELLEPKLVLGHTHQTKGA